MRGIYNIIGRLRKALLNTCGKEHSTNQIGCQYLQISEDEPEITVCCRKKWDMMAKTWGLSEGVCSLMVVQAITLRLFSLGLKNINIPFLNVAIRWNNSELIFS